VAIASFDTDDAPWEGQSSGSSRRQRLTSNGRDVSEDPRACPLFRKPSKAYELSSG
jgi:hypothetical protein